MNYKEYESVTRRLNAEQRALDKRFIKEYPHRDKIGKVVTVRYWFRGRLHSVLAFFESLEPFCHDIAPVFRYLRDDGKPSKTRIGCIYSVKQIEEIKVQ